MQETFEINQASLERARHRSDRDWLESTFNRARQVISSGGKVNISQQFSDSSIELVAIIDTKELLGYFQKKYQQK